MPRREVEKKAQVMAKHFAINGVLMIGSSVSETRSCTKERDVTRTEHRIDRIASKWNNSDAKEPVLQLVGRSCRNRGLDAVSRPDVVCIRQRREGDGIQLGESVSGNGH